MPDDYEADLVKRLGECQTIISDIEGSPAWKVIYADLKLQQEQLDSNWQDITDPLKLQKARELKNAVKHLLNLKVSYSQEIEALGKELKHLQDPSSAVMKDYDTETMVED